MVTYRQWDSFDNDTKNSNNNDDDNNNNDNNNNDSNEYNDNNNDDDVDDDDYGDNDNDYDYDNDNNKTYRLKLFFSTAKGSPQETICWTRPLMDWPQPLLLPRVTAPGSIHWLRPLHYDDVIMGVIASQITSLAIVYSTVYSNAD